MKKIAAGIIIGAFLSFSTVAFAASVKEYILSEVSYPIFVNGVEYSDSELPILNYNGNTYIPLSKIGDITGLNYKWNDELKRVEISTSDAFGTTDTPDTPGSSSTSGTPGSSSSLEFSFEIEDFSQDFDYNYNDIFSRELTEQEIIKKFQENMKFEVIEE